MTTHYQTADFDAKVLSSDRPVLVDFHAEWCGPCKMLGPVIEGLSRELDGQVSVGKVDVDQAPELAQRYGITSIPALILFKDGQPIARTQGFQPAPVLKRWVLDHAA